MRKVAGTSLTWRFAPRQTQKPFVWHNRQRQRLRFLQCCLQCTAHPTCLCWTGTFIDCKFGFDCLRSGYCDWLNHKMRFYSNWTVVRLFCANADSCVLCRNRPDLHRCVCGHRNTINNEAIPCIYSVLSLPTVCY